MKEAIWIFLGDESNTLFWQDIVTEGEMAASTDVLMVWPVLFGSSTWLGWHFLHTAFGKLTIALQ